MVVLDLIRVYTVFDEKTYRQAPGRFEWENGRTRVMTRVRFSTQNRAVIFIEPLLLVSNLAVKKGAALQQNKLAKK